MIIDVPPNETEAPNIPENAIGDEKTLSNYSLQDKNNNPVSSRMENGQNVLYLTKNSKEYELKKDDSGSYYIENNGNKEYVQLNTVPVIAKVSLKKNAVLTRDTISSGNNTTSDDVRKQEYNISVYLDEENEENEEITKEIAALEDIDRIAIEKSGIYRIKAPKYTEKFVKYEGIENREEENAITVISLGKQEYENYLKKLNLKYENVKDKAILINNSFAQVYDDKNEIFVQEEIDIYTYKAGDILKGNIIKMDASGINVAQYIEKDLEIAKTTNIRPLGLENAVGTAYIIVSDENMENFIPRNSRTIYINSSNPEKLQDKIEKIVEGQNYNLFNSAKEEKNMQSIYTLIQIFLYGFIIVIALIGITNIFNTITTNMELRSREFAMLKSIGMTKKEFNRMVRLESLFYGTKSLLIGIPIGIGLSYLIYKALTAGLVVIKYEVPVVGILISIVAVFALIFCIMKYSINKINKQNTIETIRNENI